MPSEPKCVLFVEDVYASIAGVYESILAYRPGWRPALRCTVPEAWDYLGAHANVVKAIVLDVMLPSVDGVPPRDEGLYLAAWIRRIMDPPSALSPMTYWPAPQNLIQAL
jgi:hypothetical protein